MFLSSQTVVLINGVPTKVILEGTEIKDVQGEVSSYMSGYEKNKKTSAFQYAQLNQSGSTAAKVQDNTASALVISKTKVSDSPIVSGNYFKFENDSALLSILAINDIKDHANKIKSGLATSILLESFHLSENEESIELIRNRLDACKKYFEINGVPSNAIVTNMYPNDKESNKVSVTLR